MMKGRRGIISYEVKATTEPVNKQNLDDKQVFRGYLNGAAFVTKKNYRGTKMDSLWVRHLFDSFDTDDDELAAIALQSILADVETTVISGEYGSPFMIGEYGFYADNQFEQQAAVLKEAEYENSKGQSYFLSRRQWDAVNEKLTAFAQFGKGRFYKAVRGDSFATLAVRKNAFIVAKLMISRGIDPLRTNEDGDDFFVTLKDQYGMISSELKSVEERTLEAAHKVIVPTEAAALKKQESNLLQNLNNLVMLIRVIKESLTVRIQSIDHFKWIKKKAELRKEPVPVDVQWNLDQMDKAVGYITESDRLIQDINSKIYRHEKQFADHQSLAALMLDHHATLVTTATAITSSSSASGNITARSSPAILSGKEEIAAQDGSGSAKDVSSGGHASASLIGEHGTVLVVADAAARLNRLHKRAGARSKEELYKKLGMALEKEKEVAKVMVEKYSVPIGVLRQTELETVMYR